MYLKISSNRKKYFFLPKIKGEITYFGAFGKLSDVCGCKERTDLFLLYGQFDRKLIRHLFSDSFLSVV